METLVKILSMDVISESDLSKQEKLELLDFVMETQDFHVLQEVLASYDLVENCEECEEDEEPEYKEDEKKEKLSLEDLDEIEVPLVLEKFPGRSWVRGGARPSVVSFMKKEKGEKMSIPSSTQHIHQGLRTKLPGGLVRVRPNPAPPASYL